MYENIKWIIGLRASQINPNGESVTRILWVRDSKGTVAGNVRDAMIFLTLEHAAECVVARNNIDVKYISPESALNLLVEYPYFIIPLPESIMECLKGDFNVSDT